MTKVKVKIKTGDQVKIITGKDRGKSGKVLQVFSARNRASIEGLNLAIKHMRPSKQGEKGQRIEFPAPINLSNVMLICPKCSKVTRISKSEVKSQNLKTNEDQKIEKIKKQKKHRICKKCNKIID